MVCSRFEVRYPERDELSFLGSGQVTGVLHILPGRVVNRWSLVFNRTEWQSVCVDQSSERGILDPLWAKDAIRLLSMRRFYWNLSTVSDAKNCQITVP